MLPNKFGLCGKDIVSTSDKLLVEGDSSGYFSAASTTVSIPPFTAFDSATELWPDYWSRFRTFVAANAVPEKRMAQVFLTNQTATVYKQLANLATQQNPPKDINNLIMDEIVDFMKEQFDPKLFIKLGGGFGYTKIDLADAYNQIKLAPESQRRLALSTHRGVLLQQRLPFGIKSAPGYFQEIMENLTHDLPGVAV
ncbi:uncharacterized protein LOC128247867 [Octopus bimaculoides]|uniref:uncharacterized protein LOC128247867 n=1 Tax=Octopus bimaculoides TaxID=37653 RepID=UPI0022E5C920|nr:uncharacterized protein LOC128247867 [Octopus bimaculoides]